MDLRKKADYASHHFFPYGNRQELCDIFPYFYHFRHDSIYSMHTMLMTFNYFGPKDVLLKEKNQKEKPREVEN